MGIKMTKTKYFSILASFLFIVQTVSAQEKKEIYQRNGQDFYGHIVKKGNTLYSISRQYSVSIEDILKQNPDLTKELSIGDTLWIAAKNAEQKRPNINSSNYLTYKVQAKNTLYSIAKEYDVEIKDIVLANPELQNGLKVGMELRIPLAKLRKQEEKPSLVQYSIMDKYETHLVKPKETLYSLSKKYDVKIDSILLMNNGLVEGLKVGQEIILPILKKDASSGLPFGVSDLEFDSSKIKKKYHIALLLPFYLDKIQEPTDSTDYEFLEHEQLLFRHAKYGIELYEGFMLALDSIRNNGLSAELHIFDAANDTAKIQEIISKPVMKKMDLIIGPLFYNEFMIAANFAKKHKINIVSPVKQSNKILLGNNYVSKVISSDPILVQSLAEFVEDSLKNENVVVVYSDNLKERINLEQFNAAFESARSKSRDSAFFRKPIIFEWENNESIKSLKSKLLPDSTSQKENYIVVLSDNQAMVTQLLTSLNSVHHQYNIHVIGREDWEDYGNLDVDYLHNLNVHLVLPEFIDESDDKTIAFKNKFYDTYQCLPGKFAYLGYDVGFYYLSLLNRYGNNINYKFAEHKITMLGRNFNFIKTGIESGYENHSYNLVKYEDYQIKKVK